jgi:transcriptional regulator with XRE-family HTH domain
VERTLTDKRFVLQAVTVPHRASPRPSYGPDPREDALRDAIRALLTLRTQQTIAQRAGIAKETLSRFLSGRQSLSPKKMLALSIALGEIHREFDEAWFRIPDGADETSAAIQQKLTNIGRLNNQLLKETKELERLLSHQAEREGKQIGPLKKRV